MFSSFTLFAILARWLKPHHTIPHTPWRSNGRWDLSLLRLLILISGLAFFGFGEALLVQSNIGNSPWSVFGQGISRHTGLSLGWSTFFISCAILVFWLPLKERLGFGTLANAVVIPLTLQLGVDHLPLQHGYLSGIAMALAGIALVGISTAMYISCGLGPGPRDGLMTALHHRTKIRIGRVRLAIEASVVLMGFALGGNAGLGTILFALFVGQSVAISCGVLARITHQ